MFKILIFSLLFCTQAFAQNLSQVEQVSYSPGLSSYKNYVKNPDCWKNTAGVTVSAGTFSKSTSTPLNGDTGTQCNIISTGSAQSYCWTTNALGEDLKGQNCEAKFVYKGNASLYKTYVTQGSTQVSTDLQLTNPTYSQPVSINFPCGDLSTSTSVCLATTGTNAATINVGKVYVGGATNLGIGAIVTPSQAYTPIYTLNGGAFGTNTTIATWRQVGDRMEISYTLLQSGAGTAGTSVYLIGIPSGYTMDTNKVSLNTTFTNGVIGKGSAVGKGWTATTTSGNTNYSTPTTVVAYSSTQLV
jgi:hypothetical protein